MEDILYYSELYDIYKKLLTSKQQLYFEEYYFNNLSLSEIAENYSISRNAVFNQLKNIVKYLKDYDDKLGLLAKKRYIEEIISSNEEFVSVESLKDLF